MIVEFKVQCDCCGRIVDVKKEAYLTTINGDLCVQCFAENKGDKDER